jgi:ubiquinone/menaquinone biosynthesis C-methylase UbiE
MLEAFGTPMPRIVERFTTRVDTYVKYRPSYPPGVIELLKTECGLSKASVIADIGSGTGKLTELFLNNGNIVFGVEPNLAMREAGETLLKHYSQFTSMEGSAEATTLRDASVDFVSAGQAFHWFDSKRARTEFARILKLEGFVVLIWNDRRLDSTPFLREYEQLLQTYGTDYEEVRSLNSTEAIFEFFTPEIFKFKSFENSQEFDFESLKGRVLSASYTPQPGQPNFEPMMARLREIFEANNRNESITFEYDTKVYYGHLVPN